jgi:phage portal protein BeeE
MAEALITVRVARERIVETLRGGWEPEPWAWDEWEGPSRYAPECPSPCRIGRACYHAEMSTASTVLNQLHAGLPGGIAPTPAPYEPVRVPQSVGAARGLPIPQGWNLSKSAEEGLKTNAILAKISHEIGERAADVPWHWWERDTVNGSKTKKEPVDFIERPRQNKALGYGRFDLLEEAHLYLGGGNALIGIIWDNPRSPNRMPRELKTESTIGVRQILSKVPGMGVEAWEWDDVEGRGFESWQAEDMVHVIGRRDPLNPYWGWDIVKALAETLDADKQAHRLNYMRFLNGGNPGTIIIDPNIKGPNAEDDRIEAQENLNRDSHKYYGGYLVLGGDQTVATQQSLTSTELGLLEAMAEHRIEIALAKGYLPAMVDASAQTFDNVDHAIKHIWRLAVLANARIADAFTLRFVPDRDFGKRWIAPCYAEVEELKDLTGKIERMEKLVDKCRYAVNDAIDVVGLPGPHQDGGYKALVAANLVPDTFAAESFD